MRKITTLLTTLVLVLSLLACVAPTSAAEGSTAPETVAFDDPVLEAMVRAAMGKPDGAITVAEAEAVTKLDVSFEWQQYVSEATPIEDIGGLEHFKNLESLDLSFHAITDITPLASLTKLTILVLSGNPVADITPLQALSALKVLVMSECAAQDYSPLANLTNLEYLSLERSTIADATPLASLTSLKRLYLEGCDLDYAPIANIYPALEDRDFVILPAPSTLAELGFVMDGDGKQAVFDGEQVSVRINHIEWGTPTAMGAENCVRTVFGTGEYKVDIGYYPEHDAYVIQAYQNGEFVVNYVYTVSDGSVNCSNKDRERYEDHLRKIFPAAAGEDLLLEPVSFYNAALEDALDMTATELFALPFEPLSLKSMGFEENEEGQGYLSVHRESDDYFDISIHDPKQAAWEGGGDVRFFTPLSDEYRIVVTYYVDEKRFGVGADDNDGGGAKYNFFIDSGVFIDEWCSDENLTVEQYFMKAINDPQVTDTSDIYEYSVKLMVKTVEDTFGMSIDALYALPFEQSNAGGDATVAGSVAEGSLTWLGFDLDEAGVCAVYEDREPHYKSVAIARPEWGEFDGDWNIEFIDTDINGYSLRITYHANEGEYLVSLEKDGVGCSYHYYPATDDKGWEEPDLDTVQRMFNDALGTKGKELYYVPLEQFEQYVHEHFDMSVDELYELPRY